MVLKQLLAVGIAGALCIGTAAGQAEARGKFVVTFLELARAPGCGFGMAAVLQTPGGRTYIVDAGGASQKAGEYDAGRDAIAPFLKARKITEISGIAISHSHDDHYGGAPYLLDHFTVRRLYDPGYEGIGMNDFYRAIRKRMKERDAYQVVQAGGKLDWDQALEIRALSPPPEFLNVEPPPDDPPGHYLPNLNSLVLRVRHGKNIFLFPGDVTPEGQDLMLKTWKPEDLKTTVLAVPGHGFCSHGKFAQVAKPQIAVASVLGDSSAAWRAAEVYGKVGARVYVTGWQGTVEIVSDGETCTVRTEHSLSAR